LTAIRDFAWGFKAAFGNLKEVHALHASLPRGGGRVEKLLSGFLYLAPILIAIGSGRTLMTRTRTLWGDRMLVVLPELGSVQLALRGYFEPGLTYAISSLLRDGMTFVDVGAHFGYYSILASLAVGANGQVHAFEPTPGSFHLLRLNTAKLGNVTTRNYACYSSSGKITMFDYGARYSGFNSITRPRMDAIQGGREFVANTVRLDDYADRTGIKPDFVKIDAESAEADVLEGMSKIMNQYHPIVALEVGDFLDEVISSKELILRLVKKGYAGFECRNQRLQRHEIRERYGYDNLIFL